MNFRAGLAWVVCGALVLASAALYFAGPAAAVLSVASALAGLVAGALLRRDKSDARRTGAASAAPLSEMPGAGVEAKHPTVAGAVAAGEVPAGALLEATVDSMREGVLVIDSTMRVVASNESARAIFNTGGEGPLRARRLSELTRDPAVYSAFAAAAARGERAEVHVERTTAAGERRVYELRVAPLRQREVVFGSDVRGAVGVFFDVTRLDRLERVRQEFLSNVSHELRTPLTAILTHAETLEEAGTEDPETARRFLSVIRRNSERMRDLINDILELSAIEAGTVRVTPEELRLAPLVEECFAALAPRAAERNVTLRSEVSPDTTVRADPRRLEQMLTNLLDNAVKFNHEGGNITVRHERDDGRDLLHVTDQGEGIPAQHLARIFERFYRVDRARSRSLGGTGLGLAIVKHLARAHGGDVSVSSTAGEGATFTVELPATHAT